MIRDEALLAHKRAVEAERKAQAILRRKAQSPAVLMARVAAAPKPQPPFIPASEYIARRR